MYDKFFFFIPRNIGQDLIFKGQASMGIKNNLNKKKLLFCVKTPIGI